MCAGGGVMRPDQRQRYARHCQLAEFGESGQTAMMQASAHVTWTDADQRPQVVAAMYLAAGGVGRLVVPDANTDQRRELASHGPDTLVASDGSGRSVECSTRPAWWPSTPDDDEALAFFTGGVAAAHWMAKTVR